MTENRKIQFKKWKDIIKKCKKSNIKVLDWCKQNNISKHKYYYWHREIRREEANNIKPQPKAKPSEEKEENTFVEVNPIILPDKENSNSSTIAARIRSSNLEIELFEESSSTFIKKILGVLNDA